MPVISIVSTLYRSQNTLSEFLRRIHDAASSLTDDFEVILVNDGCPERSLEVALGLLPEYPRTQVVELSKNFGHHPAIHTGLLQSRGDYVFLIDSDLEEAPELLIPFYRELSTSSWDVIYGVQDSRARGLMRGTLGKLFYLVFNALSTQPIPVNVLTVRLMTKRFVDACRQYKETQIFLGGLWALAGFRQKAVSVSKGSRANTSYSFGRRLGLLVDAITSFSHKPLLYVFYTGLVMAVVSGIGGLALFLVSIFSGQQYLGGWRSVILSIWFIGGLTICSIGVLGVYLSKIFLEVKRRPLALIREIHRASPVPEEHC